MTLIRNTKSTNIFNMKRSKTLLIIFLISLIVSCAEAEETPVEVYYGDVTNEQMFINIKIMI